MSIPKNTDNTASEMRKTEMITPVVTQPRRSGRLVGLGTPGPGIGYAAVPESQPGTPDPPVDMADRLVQRSAAPGASNLVP
jgi:hypothetical protein